MFEVLATIALAYFLIALAVANVDVLRDFFTGYPEPERSLLLGVLWPSVAVLMVSDAFSYVVFQVRSFFRR